MILDGINLETKIYKNYNYEISLSEVTTIIKSLEDYMKISDKINKTSFHKDIYKALNIAVDLLNHLQTEGVE